MSSRTDTPGVPFHGTLELAGNLGTSALMLSRKLLESGAAAAVFTLRQAGSGGRFCWSLISDPALLDQAVPFHPVMPVQGAKVLSGLTGTGSLNKPVAAFIRPCELRAFVENVKQHRGSFENLLVISCSCMGVLPSSVLATPDGAVAMEEFITASSVDLLVAGVRDSCKRCVHPTPEDGADLVMAEAGEPGSRHTLLHVQNDHALEAIRLLSMQDLLEEARRVAIPEARQEERRRNLETLMSTRPEPGQGLESLVRLLSSCLGCRACREVCPLCHCILCDYETDRTRCSPELVRDLADSRGALRVPTGTIQFHLGRLVHISPVCVSCGQCSEACPVRIPVSDLFARASGPVQTSLGYFPGADREGKPPLAVYLERELEELTD
jgi:formate dehydrogenase (coenzyme F420) beta subunit